MFAAVNKQDNLIYVSYRGSDNIYDWFHNFTSVASGHLITDVASKVINKVSAASMAIFKV